MIQEKFTGERFIPGIDDEMLSIEHMQRYMGVREMVRGKVVLDAACGEGYGSRILAETAEKVTGIDINETTIQNAREKYALTRNLDFLCGSIERIPIENHSIDVVISFETITLELYVSKGGKIASLVSS